MMRQKLKLIAVNLLIVVVLLFLIDQLLAALGFRSDIPFRTAHRENRTKVLRNIEFEFEFSTNQHGLRYPHIPLQKPAEEVRILMLGDSFTEGVGVEAAETFGVDLENRFNRPKGNKVRFVNGGLGGQGPMEFWRLFRDVGVKLDPDGLLLCLYGNDLSDTPESLSRDDLYRRYPERQGIAGRLHSLIPRVYIIANEAFRVIAREIRQSRGFIGTVESYAIEQGISEDTFRQWSEALPGELVDAADRGEFNKSLLSQGLFNPGFWVEALEINTPRAEKKYQSMKMVLNEIIEVARQKGMAIGVVYIPVPLQYDLSRHASWNPWILGGVQVNERWTHDVTELQKRLADWAQIESIPFLDLTPILREEVKRGRDLNYRLDGHWTAGGHRVAGKAIAEWINQGAVFPSLPLKEIVTKTKEPAYSEPEP